MRVAALTPPLPTHQQAQFCGKHAAPGMVDVISKKCNFEGCTKHPSFGVEGTRNREYCAKHAPEGMIILGKAGRPKQIPGDRKRRASTGVGGAETTAR